MVEVRASRSVLKQEPNLFNRNFLLLVLCHFLQALGWSSMLLLPRYFDVLGQSREDIGILMASASFGGLVIRPLVGWALDCYGKRICLTLGAIFLAAGMWGLSIEAPRFEELLIARIAVGIGAGTLFTGYFAFVALHIPAARRTEGLALFGISGILPLGLNAITGQVFADPMIVPTIFPTLTIPIILSGALNWLVDENTKGSTPTDAPPFRLNELVRPSLLPVWLASLVFSMLVASFMAFATLCAPLEAAHNPQSLWLYYAVGAVGVRVFASKLPDKLGPHNFVVPSLGFYCLSFLLLVDGDTTGLYNTAGLLAGLGHGYCFPVLTAQVISRVPLAGTSRGLAMFTALWELSALATTGPLGAFADEKGLAPMCGLVVCTSLGLLSFWVYLEHRYSSSTIKKLTM